MKLGIYGAGGLGREVLVLAQQLNSSRRWEEIFFIDDVTSENIVAGIPVYHFALLDHVNTEIVIALGEPVARQKLAEKVLKKCALSTLIHPSVFIPPDSQIGAGAILCNGAFISSNVTVGENVLVQPQACLGHDTEVKAHSVISSNVTLAGHCQLGLRVFIGMNCAVKENTAIGDDAIVGMGSAVFSDIPPATISLGNPARAMRKNEQGKVFK
ncbi:MULTISPECIES: acetyltransferase [Enterobacter]|uniref:Sugar O-acyltransferase n=1 Tax=Enterobacter cloacae TaxID=550 RepID=A0A330GA27_ENTCL|nr:MULTISPECIES: acetyltransferase [Enterobacter cloacae complex]MEC5766278.1 acetyltransferase [Enterobacter chengduensis]NBC81365.1 sugar O-acyltransferase [Enterobacter asburiae]RAZ62763.1 sugar O-acyltransferase [Enterobacter cloacae]HBM9902156.1 acetyltransferase [Enterobacter chengduensis]